MAEVLASFSTPVTDQFGSYYPRAVGRLAPDNMWEGWIEFVPVSGGQPLRSSRETTQPNRTDAEYWATGLTMVYLEGALNRALNPPVRKVVTKPHAMFDEPSRGITVSTLPNATQDAILDPFSVYEKGEKLLRQELGALATWHLVNIARAYELSDEPAAVLNALPATRLVEIIVQGVRSQAGVQRGR